MTIEEILAGESKNIEFKECLPEKSIKYMKSVVAFANGIGGKIIFGVVDESREIVGIDKESVFTTMDAIANAISDSCEPAIIPDISLKTVENRTVIVVEIQPGRQKPYYIKSMGIDNGTYVRVAGTSRPADRDTIREMYYEQDGHSYDNVIRKDITVSDEEIEQLCFDMKQVALANCKNETQRMMVKDVTKNVLISWGILAETEEGVKPTNAYAFLTGQDPFLSMIQCGMFKGTTRAVFVDKREYTGPLWKQVDEAFKFVLRNIRLGAKLEGIYRKDIYELPPDSIRELIINAVMNCSFLQSSHIQVAIYDNRLEITSPGGLMPGVTVGKMKEGYSKIRNKALAHAFYYMNLVEAWGSGIPKLMKAMGEYGLKEPEFIDLDIGFRINLYREENVMTYTDVPEVDPDVPEVDPDVPKVDPDFSKNLLDTFKRDSDNEDLNFLVRLLEVIQKSPELTQKVLGEKLGVSSKTIKRALAKLQKEGIVLREGSNRKGKWIIVKKNERSLRKDS